MQPFKGLNTTFIESLVYPASWSGLPSSNEVRAKGMWTRGRGRGELICVELVLSFSYVQPPAAATLVTAVAMGCNFNVKHIAVGESIA